MADNQADSTTVDATDAPSGTTAHYLSPEHQQELEASGIDYATAVRNCVHTEVDATSVGRLLGYKGPAKKFGDCLVYPFRDIDGNAVPYHQLKPANPPKETKGPDRGKVRKYLCPYGRTFRAYFPADAVPHLKDSGVPLFVTEGPKKALCGTANGFVTVALVGVWNFGKQRRVDKDSNPVGDRELIPDLAALALKDRDVYIAYDSDRAENGSVRAAERELAGCLRRAGAKVWLVVIPQADDGSKQGIDDYIVAHGKGKFEELVKTATEVEDGTDTDRRPKVYATANVAEMARRVREVLATVPGVYARGNALVQEVIEVGHGGSRLRAVERAYLPELLSQHIRFVSKKVDRNGSEEEKDVPPPFDAYAPVFARPCHPIREVGMVVEHPVMLKDGRILSESGYDPASGVLVRMPDGFSLPTGQEFPTREDATAAAARVLDLFAEFPLKDANDDDPPDGKARGSHSRAAIFALLVTVIARPAISGPTPFFLVDKNSPAAGGTLILKTWGTILTGREFPASSYPGGGSDEMRKIITCWATEAWEVANLDNIDDDLGGAHLCRAITATWWTDRLLTVSKTYTGPLNTVQIGSAINARLITEMPRRVVRIGIETKHAHPEERTGFRYDLTTYPLSHRRQLLADVVTVLRAWVQAGRPSFPMTGFASFESWSELVRNVCLFAGLADPHLPQAGRNDRQTRLLRTVCEGILAMDPNGEGLAANQIVKRLEEVKFDERTEIMMAAHAAAELFPKGLTAESLGCKLAAAVDRPLGGIVVRTKPSRHRENMNLYAVERCDSPSPDANSAPEPPAPPAGGLTSEQVFAGGAGGDNATPATAREKSKRRSGRLENNPHRGTLFDKEVTS